MKVRNGLRDIWLFSFAIVTGSFMLVNCGGGEDSGTVSNNVTYAVGGTVSGLIGSTLVMQNNNGDDLGVTKNGSFIFVKPIPDGFAYDVTIKSQPTDPNQVCSVKNGSGVISGANVTNIEVNCANCTGGSIEYNHNLSSDAPGFSQQMVVTGSIPFSCGATNEIFGSGMVSIAVTGLAVTVCSECTWSGDADMNVTLSEGSSGFGAIDFTEIWYAGSPPVTWACTDTCNGGTNLFQSFLPEQYIEHTLELQMINGYKHVGVAQGQGTSGTYEWTFYIN
ncbi:MAG: hypothetical protein OEY66_06365 [Gammaproteobacteria bacterium]|nr:hypothetical protein [Gammaproteobacteria bacterium]